MSNTSIKLMSQAIKEKNARRIVALFASLSISDIEQRDEKTGMNIIHYAVSENAFKELYIIFTQYKSLNINLKTNGIQGKTALEIACGKGNVEMVKLLLQHGANIEDIREVQKKYKSDSSLLSVIENAIGIPKKKSFFSFFN